jgi:hypothetical protein
MTLTARAMYLSARGTAHHVLLTKPVLIPGSRIRVLGYDRSIERELPDFVRAAIAEPEAQA